MRKTKSEVAPSAGQLKALNPAERITVDGHSYRLVREPVPHSAEPPFTPVVIGGKTYKMCFEMNELCDAEIALMGQGHDVNLLRLFGNFSLRAVGRCSR